MPMLAHRRHVGRILLHLTLAAAQASHDARSLRGLRSARLAMARLAMAAGRGADMGGSNDSTLGGGEGGWKGNAAGGAGNMVAGAGHGLDAGTKEAGTYSDTEQRESRRGPGQIAGRDNITVGTRWNTSDRVLSTRATGPCWGQRAARDISTTSQGPRHRRG